MPMTKSITAMRTPFMFDRDIPGQPQQQCPPWCELERGHGGGEQCLAHIAGAYELEDRLELCVMQVISTDADDQEHSPDRPAQFYFWMAEQAVLEVSELAELADALNRAGGLLASIAAARDPRRATPRTLVTTH